MIKYMKVSSANGALNCLHHIFIEQFGCSKVAWLNKYQKNAYPDDAELERRSLSCRLGFT